MSTQTHQFNLDFKNHFTTKALFNHETVKKKKIGKSPLERREKANSENPEMEGPVKFLRILGMLVVLVSIGGAGAGECGRSTTPDNEALKLAPCATAAQLLKVAEIKEDKA
ncbi:hypothetical protein K1719_044186 [Acacia pycnantha]|nr:hypothetical protein K1719_044186 [Acacia pycnantha]